MKQAPKETREQYIARRTQEIFGRRLPLGRMLGFGRDGLVERELTSDDPNYFAPRDTSTIVSLEQPLSEMVEDGAMTEHMTNYMHDELGMSDAQTQESLLEFSRKKNRAPAEYWVDYYDKKLDSQQWGTRIKELVKHNTVRFAAVAALFGMGGYMLNKQKTENQSRNEHLPDIPQTRVIDKNIEIMSNIISRLNYPAKLNELSDTDLLDAKAVEKKLKEAPDYEAPKDPDLIYSISGPNSSGYDVRHSKPESLGDGAFIISMKKGLPTISASPQR